MDCPKDDHSNHIPQNDKGFYEKSPLDVFFHAGLFCISAASIEFEIILTRLFSIAQFYHFAFMIVSTALLGNAASGILLMLFPKVGRLSPKVLLPWTALCAGISMIGAYILFNLIPFDSFSVSWDIRQAGLLLFHYLLLSMPFLFCGIAVSYLLSAFPKNSGKIYSINLTGSALGCIFALVLPGVLGGDGIVFFCSGLAAIGALLFGINQGNHTSSNITDKQNILLVRAPVIIAFIVILFAGTDAGFRLFDRPLMPWMTLKISPYKGLSQVRQIPNTKLLSQKWNAFSRIDLVESSAVRSLPGLSYRYQSALPLQNGLFVDGDDMSPVLMSDEVNAFYDYLPLGLAFRLRPQAKTLILEPRGGLDILTALNQGACCVIAVEQNPLIVSMAEDVYAKPQVKTVVEFERSYLKRTDEYFDVILISLTSGYHPIQSGAYSLAEDYRYTIEAFQDSLNHLTENGLLIFMRWLQNPPSEDFRAFSLAVETLDRTGGDARNQIVAYRGYNTAIVMIKRAPFTPIEMAAIREFCADRAFDLSYSPDIKPEETNRYNILPVSVYYQSYRSLIESKDRQTFYQQYPYDITPPTDDHPFMGHYFKWTQIDQIIAGWGKTWQPFGGAGYLVIVGLLLLTIVAGSGLVLLPWIVRITRRKEYADLLTPPQPSLRYFIYFACIGLGYLLVEISLIQKFILFLEQPAYAFTSILFSILLFSGCGSLFAHKISLRKCLIGITGLVLIFPVVMPTLFEEMLGLMLGWRMVITIMFVAPLGFLMGMPFPSGLRWFIEKGYAAYIPWFWGVNGAASVVSAILAAMLALSFGFSWVLRIGAAAYLLGWLMVSWVNQPALKLLRRR